MATVSGLAHSDSASRSMPVLSWLNRKNRGYYLAGYLILFVMGAWTAFPFYWQVATSLRLDVDLYTPVVAVIPHTLTLDHYNKVLFGAQSQFLLQIKNSMIVAASTTVIAIFLGSMAGYALTRLSFLGRAGLARILIYAYLAPGSILFIPLYVMMNNFGLRDSLGGLVLAHLTFSVPFATWLLMGYFKTIPVELEEAALVDGAGRVTALWRIILPLAAPAIVVVAVFAFTLSWNEFLYALVFIQDETSITVPVGLNLLIYGDVFSWGQLMAASVITTLPVVGLYMFIHRWMVEGLATGSVKG